MNGTGFLQKAPLLIRLPYTQDHRSGCNITKSLDFSILLRSFDLRQKKNICKFRLHFCKSVQTFHAKSGLSYILGQTTFGSCFSRRAFSLTTAMQSLRFDNNVYFTSYLHLVNFQLPISNLSAVIGFVNFRVSINSSVTVTRNCFPSRVTK